MGGWSQRREKERFCCTGRVESAQNRFAKVIERKEKIFRWQERKLHLSAFQKHRANLPSNQRSEVQSQPDLNVT